MISGGMRPWLPPVCLVAVMAVVWVLPFDPNCDALDWGDDPAIARVGIECVLLSDFADKLRIVEAGIEYAERELRPDDLDMDEWRVRHERVMSYGPETAALAGAIWESALYQQAVSDGHIPTDDEVSHYRDRDRLGSESTADFIELVKLAEKSDLVGIEELLERSDSPDFEIYRNMGLPELQESFQGSNSREFRELEESVREWEAYLDSVGREAYWNKIYPTELRRDLSIDRLEQEVMDVSIDGPWEIPRLAWLSYQRETLSRISVVSTSAVPTDANMDSALAYLAESLETERRSLNKRYERRRRR